MPDSDNNSSEMKGTAIRAYRAMLVARAFDSKISSLYKAGKITGGVFLGRGHEAIAASGGVCIRRGEDIFSPFIREQAARYAWGEPIIEAARSYLGSSLGYTRGRDGNVHRGVPAEGYIIPISHLGSTVAVVLGALFAKKLDDKLGDTIGMVFCGDGTTSTGSFHEACNLASVEQLPVVVVVSNNKFAYSTPNEHEFGCKSLVDRGKGYGTDFLATLKTFQKAVGAARAGKGPQWILANTLRMCGHGEHDSATYIPEALKQEYAVKDPLLVSERQLLECGWITAEENEEWKAAATEEVQTAVARAQREPEPDPYRDDWNATVWRPY
ncbi:MAG: thiamine pyrophosphate-dependent dehydrogenase E1 component subunit alpha [Akkermansia sp.]